MTIMTERVVCLHLFIIKSERHRLKKIAFNFFFYALITLCFYKTYTKVLFEHHLLSLTLYGVY